MLIDHAFGIDTGTDRLLQDALADRAVVSLVENREYRPEAAQLERGEALKKLCVFGLHVALVQLQLVTEREGEAGASASLVWSAEAEAFICSKVSSNGP